MSSTPFAVILDNHFSMNKDYLLDLLLDLLQAEQELSQTFKESQVDSEGQGIAKFRRKLVEWMIQLSDELKLGYKTKQTAVILADLALSKLKIHKNFLQLLGITCVFIAVKCEESFTYTLDNAREHCANTYSKQEIGAMEMLIFKTLKWKLNYPTPGDIARRLVHASGATSISNMPKFFKRIDNFIDLCLSENDMSVFTPSTIAAASIMCAFGNNQDHLERWTNLIANNGIFQLDFDAIEVLYKHTVQQLRKYNPEYFNALFSTSNEQEVTQEAAKPQMSPTHEDQFNCGDSQTTVECSQEMSVVSFGSQETYCCEPNNEEVVLESLSQVGTPIKDAKNTPNMGYKISLLDTEKLMRSNFNNSSNHTNWNGSSTAMDEEKSF